MSPDNESLSPDSNDLSPKDKEDLSIISDDSGDTEIYDTNPIMLWTLQMKHPITTTVVVLTVNVLIVQNHHTQE